MKNSSNHARLFRHVINMRNRGTSQAVAAIADRLNVQGTVVVPVVVALSGSAGTVNTQEQFRALELSASDRLPYQLVGAFGTPRLRMAFMRLKDRLLITRTCTSDTKDRSCIAPSDWKATYSAWARYVAVLHLRHHLGKLLVATCAANGRLNVVTRLSPINYIARRPSHKFFATLPRQFREQSTAIRRNPATLDPVLNRLVRNAHLPRHIGNGIELGDSSLQCRVFLAHGLCQMLLNLEIILAQATLVPQEKFQLPQGFPVETMAP